jgi:hypothetical protein
MSRFYVDIDHEHFVVYEATCGPLARCRRCRQELPDFSLSSAIEKCRLITVEKCRSMAVVSWRCGRLSPAS